MPTAIDVRANENAEYTNTVMNRTADIIEEMAAGKQGWTGVMALEQADREFRHQNGHGEIQFNLIKPRDGEYPRRCFGGAFFDASDPQYPNEAFQVIPGDGTDLLELGSGHRSREGWHHPDPVPFGCQHPERHD